MESIISLEEIHMESVISAPSCLVSQILLISAFLNEESTKDSEIKRRSHFSVGFHSD